MNKNQQTLGREISFEGIGLHTGRKILLTIKPSVVNSGITFKRTDLPDQPQWKVSPESLHANNVAGRCTIIGKGESSIQTVEHVLSGLYGMGVDNATIEINGPEAPGMDGSALPFVTEIRKAGLVDQDMPRTYIVLKKPIAIHDGNSSISMYPADDFKITYVLDYDHRRLSSQVVNFILDRDKFGSEFAPARTFCLKREAEVLQKAGFGKGANCENTLVMDDAGPVENSMRFENECARHKVIDLIGDLSFLGKPVKGHIFAVRSGHHLNAVLVKAIHNQCKNNFSVEPTGDNGEIRIEEIMKALPHRYPFLLVDRIIEFEKGKRAVGLKNLTMNEIFFQGHFPAKPVMPGVLMIEAMAQVGGILLKTAEEHRHHIGLFMAVNNVKFRKTAHPGDQLVMEVEVLRDRARTASIHGTGRIAGEAVVEADMMFSFMDVEYLSS
ncbi:MAG: UDP-3-O-acyl-N-acetylglucosamine deacetylase [Candidatus Omnitrophota bacterium]